ncbi:ATP-binding protein [Mycoplasma sp. HU2014]|uniref:ATP-binding protein n=1 Tax=Mycoplasma sp. HU2014 TaxID=1664275 RepID=UPI00067C05B7|nr:DUF4143 domain-containing protein [Mycoplasma sp. HU2014]KNG79725.1 putative ATPase [Mycoplasma sp. HU2014]
MNNKLFENYKLRIIEKVIDKYLNVASAICIDGPKWCGKTSTSYYLSKSAFFVGDPSDNFSNRQLALVNPKIILNGQYPRLIDEWQEVPSIWDAVRWEVDWKNKNGMFILTGSSTPKYKGVLHSGAGRIVRVRMETMSLYESQESLGIVSLKDLCDQKVNEQLVEPLTFEQLAYLIVRGGWPKNIETPVSNCHLLPNSYIETILNESIKEIDNSRYDPLKIKLILKSLARNEATLVSEETIIKDISANDAETFSRPTINKYIDVLNRMFIFNNQEPYATNLRSSKRVMISEKKRFCDPSLACALLNVTVEKLVNDIKLFGILFESLVIRDLRVYAQALQAKVFHYRDYDNNEIDAVIELDNGNWCAIETKLSSAQIEQAAKSLNKAVKKIEKNNNKAPILKCIIVGIGNAIYKREDGIIIVPINTLKD